MLTRWSDFWGDFDRTLAWMDVVRSQMDRRFEDVGVGRSQELSAGFPRTNLYDAGSELVIRAEVPGLSEKDIQVSVNQNVLTMTGDRKPDVPEGYAVHRQERAPVRFTRSFSFPCDVDAEKAKATVRDGVLTIRIAKAAQAQPRQIAVQGG
ncbi:MAG: Hsp20/alpha crystallin family protein [Polyangiaceae bacterium]|jgi:HSP20 family protein|nr:Hsp20/alpha crystallin family protein [Polyangiaceae bacterium]